MDLLTKLSSRIFDNKLLVMVHKDCWPFNTDNEVLQHTLPWGAVICYLLMLKYLPGIVMNIRGINPEEEKKKFLEMKKSIKPKKVLGIIDYIMVGWNFFLCISSVSMVVFGFIPYVKNYLYDKGFYEAFCDPNLELTEKPNNTLSWIWLFCMYKFVELIDTFFLILKRPTRKPRFLHTYHHVTVLLCAYYAFKWKLGMGYFYGIVNGIVHSFMYYYYGWAILGKPPKWAFALTIFQITQMFYGMVVTIAFAVLVFRGEQCACSGNKWVMVAAFGIIYSSYFVLFVLFAFDRYGKKNKKKKKKRPRKEEEMIEKKVK